jgi:hypothetical protein
MQPVVPAKSWGCSRDQAIQVTAGSGNSLPIVPLEVMFAGSLEDGGTCELRDYHNGLLEISV